MRALVKKGLLARSGTTPDGKPIYPKTQKGIDNCGPTAESDLSAQPCTRKQIDEAWGLLEELQRQGMIIRRDGDALVVDCVDGLTMIRLFASQLVTDHNCARALFPKRSPRYRAKQNEIYFWGPFAGSYAADSAQRARSRTVCVLYLRERGTCADLYFLRPAAR